MEPPVLARPAGPQRLLVLSALNAIHVEAPRPSGGGVAQRPEGDRELGRPAGADTRRRYAPHGAPIGVEALALVGDQRVVLRAVRVRAEDERVAAIAGWIEQQEDRVVARHAVTPVARAHQPVALEEAGDDLARLTVAGQDADVERVVVEEDAHLGVLGGRDALEGFPLPEAGDRACQGPGRLVETAVQRDRRAVALAPRGQALCP